MAPSASDSSSGGNVNGGGERDNSSAEMAEAMRSSTLYRSRPRIFRCSSMAISDDFGVLPANPYSMNKIINTPPGIDLQKGITKMMGQKLGKINNSQEKHFFIFKANGRRRISIKRDSLLVDTHQIPWLCRAEGLREEIRELLGSSEKNPQHQDISHIEIKEAIGIKM